MKTKLIVKRIIGWFLLLHIFPALAIFLLSLEPRYQNFNILEFYGIGMLINAVIGILGGLMFLIGYLVTKD